MKTYDAHIRVVATDDNTALQNQKSVVGEETRGFSGNDVDSYVKLNLVIASGLEYDDVIIDFEELLNYELGEDVRFGMGAEADSGTPDTITGSVAGTTVELGDSGSTEEILDEGDTDDVLYLGHSVPFNSFHVEWVSDGGYDLICSYSTSTASGVNNFTNFWDSNDAPNVYDSTNKFSQSGRIAFSAPDDWIKTIYPRYSEDPFLEDSEADDGLYCIRLYCGDAGGSVVVRRIMPARVLKFLLIDSTAPIGIKLLKDPSDIAGSAQSFVANTLMLRDSLCNRILLSTQDNTGAEITIIGGLGY